MRSICRSASNGANTSSAYNVVVLTILLLPNIRCIDDYCNVEVAWLTDLSRRTIIAISLSGLQLKEAPMADAGVIGTVISGVVSLVSAYMTYRVGMKQAEQQAAPKL